MTAASVLHDQHSCIALIEITGAATTAMFALPAQGRKDLELGQIEAMMDFGNCRESAGRRSSRSGEPTIHPDILKIIDMESQGL